MAAANADFVLTLANAALASLSSFAFSAQKLDTFEVVDACAEPELPLPQPAINAAATAAKMPSRPNLGTSVIYLHPLGTFYSLATCALLRPNG